MSVGRRDESGAMRERNCLARVASARGPESLGSIVGPIEAELQGQRQLERSNEQSYDVLGKLCPIQLPDSFPEELGAERQERLDIMIDLIIIIHNLDLVVHTKLPPLVESLWRQPLVPTDVFRKRFFQRRRLSC